MSTINADRLLRACCSLEGLSVGDAFGERFFVHPDVVDCLIEERATPAAPWRFTDDTEMALSIVSILRQYEAIEQNFLARSFAQRYNSSRGYGPAMHRLLAQIQNGESWQEVAPSLFNGQGSFGNGAAMRVAPVGAFFADDLDLAIQQARASAEVTHTHPEAIAGAIAVAVAAAWAWRLQDTHSFVSSQGFLDLVLPLIPDSEVSSKLYQARELPPETPIQSAVAILGNGTHVSAQDTVPLALWCAAQHLGNFEAAMWLTVSALGDRDTTCAIVGGIVALYTGVEGIPAIWLQYREPLPKWSFHAVDTGVETITLYRPTGAKELALVKESGYQAWPPRLPSQPIFYPVLNEEYAVQIARDWNVVDSGVGYVTRFQVRADFLSRYLVQTVGASTHQEYWIPAEELPELNQNIVGLIEVIAEFHRSSSA